MVVLRMVCGLGLCIYCRENRRVVGIISIREALLRNESHYFMEIIKMD
jgi:hypothetical protein